MTRFANVKDHIRAVNIFACVRDNVVNSEDFRARIKPCTVGAPSQRSLRSSPARSQSALVGRVIGKQQARPNHFKAVPTASAINHLGDPVHAFRVV